MEIKHTSIPCKCLAIAVAALCAGCIVIPVDYHVSESRKNVNEEARADLQPGTTTIEDVLFKFGEPDEVSPDGKRLTYRWEKVKAIWIAGGTYAAASGTIDRRYDLILHFDDRSLLIREEVKKEFVGR